VLFADRCVFAPPLESERPTRAPTLLTYAGPVLDLKQFTWWENRCGYAPEIRRFLHADPENVAAAAQNFEQVWIPQWGAVQIGEPLLGIDGVVLRNVLPARAKDQAELDPVDFQLHRNCQAATWDAKRPIGAYTDDMHVPPMRATSNAVEKQNAAKMRPPTGGSFPPGS
jgi:hypothetical protein